MDFLKVYTDQPPLLFRNPAQEVPIPTQQEGEEILAYLFSLKSFDVKIRRRITLDIVKAIFDIHRKLNKMIKLSVRISDKKYAKEGFHISNRSGVNLYFSQNGTQDSASAQELKSILNFIGPQVHSLQYHFDETKPRDPNTRQPLSTGLINTIIQACPRLKKIGIYGLDIRRSNGTRIANTSVRSIEFYDKVSFGDNTSKYLSTKLPNLDYMAI